MCVPGDERLSRHLEALFLEVRRETFPGDAEANRMLTRPMRSPWHL